MPNYHRRYIPNSMYFFTVVTNQRKPIFSSDVVRNCLHNAFEHVRKRWEFEVEAIVLLPDHLHTIWRLPEGVTDYSTRWRLIKDRCTQCIRSHFNDLGPSSASRQTKNEQGVWQRRFWEHQIRDEKDFENHLNYIHYNPVKHGYVKSPSDWKWSTFERFVKFGWYPEDWGSSAPSNLLKQCVGE